MDDIRPYCARCWIEETSLDKELDQRIKSWNRDTDEIYKNLHKEVYRIVKGKTLGGETKYFVEKRMVINGWLLKVSAKKQSMKQEN
ncbi:hypothetical protein ACGO3R_05500 [Lactococcus lactis]